MSDGLFDIAPPAGETVESMRAAIEQWRLVGKLIGRAFERALLDQAYADDLAKAARRATQISGANRTLHELLEKFHLLGDAPPPVTTEFDRMLDAIRGDG